MKILHVCPLWFPASRDAPGGIETFLPGLLAALEDLGCQNTLIASGDSQTVADLVPVTPVNLYRQMEACTAWEYAYYEQHQLWLALEHAGEFDVVHSHIGPGAYMLSAVPGLGPRVLHTQHNPVTPDLEWFVRLHPDMWLSTVSRFQACKLWDQGARRCRVIDNGIDVASFTFEPESHEQLVFMGRMEWEKGADTAVQVARTLGWPLVLAGPIIDGQFFDDAIRPFLNDRIQYVGVLDHPQKNELFGQAGCALLPSRWEEPFGLVAIEAMACGTPVVALTRGALPEVVESGMTGCLAEDEEELSMLIPRALELDRSAIRARVGDRFDLRVVAEKYLQLYRRIVQERHAA